MAVWSEIQTTEIIKVNRLDAEYWHPMYISNELNLKRYPNKRLGSLVSDFRKGIFYILASEYTATGIPFYRSSNVGEIYPNNNNLVFISEYKNSKEFKTCLSYGDIMLSKTGKNAASVVMTNVCNVSQDVIAVKVRKDQINPFYLVTYLNTSSGEKELKRRFQGQVQMHLSLPETRKAIIPIIDDSIQREIEHLIKSSFEKQKHSQSLYTQAQELLERELGLDKLVFDRPLSYEARLSEVVGNNRADGEYYQPMYLKLREIIKDYKHGFSKLTDIAFSLPPNIDPSKFANTEFEYVELSSINPSLGIIGEGTKLSGKEAPSRARRILETGDILASAVVGSVDKAAIVDTESAGKLASTGFFQFRPKIIDSEYLLILIRSKLITMQLQQEATGGILSAVPDNRLHNVIIPTIQRELQKEISSLVKKSHQYFHESQNLLEQAKSRVEELIEQAVQK